MDSCNTEQLSSLSHELERYIAYVEEHGTEPIPIRNNNRDRIERLESEARDLMLQIIEIVNELEFLGYF